MTQPFISCRDDQPVLRGDEHITAGLSIVAIRNMIKEVGFSEIDYPGQRSDDFPFAIDNRYRQ